MPFADPDKQREAVRLWKEKHRKQINVSNRVANYEITEAEFYDLLKKQNHCCIICSNEFTKLSEAQIDHCHETQKVRGILCRTCNTGLGMFKDNAQLLEAAIRYLKEHNVDTSSNT